MKKARYVDPMIGTVGGDQDTSAHGGGKTHPGACTPFGMVQLSPDTISARDNGTGYNYCNDTIEGFSFVHMSGIGWYGDFGNLQIMPVVGETDLRSGSNEELPFEKGTEGWKSHFSHENEHPGAGYYSVKLDRYDILAEATVSPHTGLLRFTYPENSDARVIFNFSRRIAGHADFQSVDIVNDRRIEGVIKCTPAGGGFGRGKGNVSYNIFFACEMSVSPDKMQFFSNETYAEENLCHFEGEDVGLIAHFSNPDEPVILKCGISFVDLDGARNNLAQECKDFDFDKMREKASDAWEKVFEMVDVEGSDEIDLTIFHTCLYHVLLDPRMATDVDGRFVLADGEIRKVDYVHRTIFSGWDVYRSEFPLLSLIRPDVVNDEANSLVEMAAKANSSLPKWELVGIDAGCMVGDPGLIVVADAFVKGIRNFDVEKAYEIALASSKVQKELFRKPFKSVRPDVPQYINDAYEPHTPPYSHALSKTLEYLLADYTMARFAKAMGKDEDAEHFMNRVKRYGENFNHETGFMGPRDANGEFAQMNGMYDTNGCIEANILQQSWFAPYDVKGLAKLFGEERTIELLEGFFERADFAALWNEDYNHSNEPCHNITHYFNMLGLCHRTQYWTRRVQKEAYRTGAFGFCGNEDVGQISAWYVLSALGFAQICPGYDAYFVNTPLFKTAKLKLDKKYHSCAVSDTFVIECDKDPLEYLYIKSMSLNGKELTRPYLTYSEITSGGVLKFTLSKEPCKDFGLDVPETFLD